MYSRPTSKRRWVHGIDFSGAADAGRKIWIASGIIRGRVLHIEECRPAETLPYSNKERDTCLTALLDFIQTVGEGILGFDFPFGLPEALVKQDRWEDFVLSFSDTFSSPEEFWHTCHEAAGGHERKRVTDVENHTPFSPYNLRLYRQTYFGIRNLIEPLVRHRLACVLPMQQELPARPWIVEICPAGTLKRENLYLRYKGKSEGHRTRRAIILEGLERLGCLQISKPDLRSTVLDDHNGDALDSVIAALATFRALNSPIRLSAVRKSPYALEGYVYV